MRFRLALKTMDTKTKDQLLELFDSASYTLGFSSLEQRPMSLMDTEASVALMPYLMAQKELELNRFVPVLLQWLGSYHGLLNPTKLLKMCQMVEAMAGVDLPVLRLVSFFLKKTDPRRFKNFTVTPLASPFYFEPRLKELVDSKLRREGFYKDLPSEVGLMVSASAFKNRESNLLPEQAFLKRNEQLRTRLVHGVNYRSDAVLLLRDNSSMSAKEVADTLALSYEPAHRLTLDVRRYLELGFSLEAAV